MLNLTIAIISLILHALVVYYGWKMYRIMNPVRYWTNAWLLYSLGNLLILIRRIIGMFIIEKAAVPIMVSWSITSEYLLQVLVSILLLLFSMNLKKLYDKYFSNGINVKSWQQE